MKLFSSLASTVRMLVASCLALIVAALPVSATEPLFTHQEVMIPMRDGVRLQTVILRPIGKPGKLPILLRRAPYGVPDKAPETMPLDMRALAGDGYVFVLQNVRGRFKSEGVFAVSTLIDEKNPTAVNDATDAYDTIDWLVKNVEGHNGKVGVYGISYAGMTAGLSLLQPHPALSAVSSQGASADQWMNDDFHRYGALRLSYAFEFSVRQQAQKNAQTLFNFDTYDTYDWYLKLGSLANVNARHLKGELSFWNDLVNHPDYDDYWKKDAWARQIDGTTIPVLNVAGFWDQEDPWGPWQIYRRAERNDKAGINFMVAGPWHHGSWTRDEKGDKIGQIPFGGHETSRQFREEIEAPFFRHFLHGSGEKPSWQIKTFQTGVNAWRSYATWPPVGTEPTKLYLHRDGTLSFTPPAASETKEAAYREYVSDPANPVPYRQRPISPIGPGGDWSPWEVSDQRFVDHRPDVLTYVSAPLEQDITVTGEIAAALYASTSGSDSDFVVKLIDVYPEDFENSPRTGLKPGEYARSLNGYQLPIAMEIRRGRYNQIYEKAQPLTPDLPTRWDIPLRDHDHVFRKGHRIMVQIQSSWFPLIDRNPQKFVPSIYAAGESDFVKATQRVYSSPDLPSHISLPLGR